MTLSKHREDFQLFVVWPDLRPEWNKINIYKTLQFIGEDSEHERLMDYLARITYVNYVNPIICIFLCYIYCVDKTVESKGVRHDKEMTKALTCYCLTLNIWHVPICKISLLNFHLLVFLDQSNICMTRIMRPS